MISTVHLYCQERIVISFINDGDRGSNLFLELLENELDALLGQQYSMKYDVLNLKNSPLSTLKAIEKSYSNESDILITLGLNSSGVLKSLSSYPKPSIAGLSLERSLNDSTGIFNFTYIQSPFSIERDFEVFQSIYPFKKIGVFIEPTLLQHIEPYFKSFDHDFEFQFISISDQAEKDIRKLDSDVDAIYFLPNLYSNNKINQDLINGINDHKLPSFALFGRSDVENGILASIAPSDYIGVYARRIALNVMKIIEGQNPKSLPLQITGIEEDFVINVNTMKRLDIYPPFEVLSKASLVNIEQMIGKKYSLQSAIAEALSNNLSLQIAEKNIGVQNSEIGIATSNLLPNIKANTSLLTLDNTSADILVSANQPTAQTEWTGNIGLTQVVYSQPALANVAIQKELLKSEKAGFLAQQLDLILDVTNAYINYLQAQANQRIQNTNVQTTLTNLNIAKTKSKIGTVSNADVYGFESQLAINKSALNDAITGLEQAKIAFNQFLNKPLSEDFVLDEIQGEKLLYIYDDRLQEKIKNQYDFRKFTEFLTQYTLEHAPEIEQIKWALAAQMNSLNANKNSLYQPEIALQGNLDKTFGRYGIKISDETLKSFGNDPYRFSWNIGVNASLPIFQGNLRKKKIEKDQILLDQLQTNEALLNQTFAANIRFSIENLGNSYNDIQFTEQAEKSSYQYLKLVQDLYREGVTNIVTLLDAQTNAVTAQLSAVTAKYQFILDGIALERLSNNIYILSSQKEREDFIDAFLAYLIKKEK